ncbi:MAG TPA: DHH family phosphoesterase [Pirellulaceae bacterium]
MAVSHVNSPTSSVRWDEFREAVGRARTFVLTSHIRPDCDALGSELGMAGILRSMGKVVRIVNGQSTPPNLTFLDPRGELETLGEEVTPADVLACDALIVLDTSAWIQLGSMADVVREFAGFKILIDHHASDDDLGAIRFKDTSIEATGRLVLEAADALGVPLTSEMATALFAAIATDTGWFRFGSTKGETYRVAARLVDAGAVPASIFQALYERDTAGRVRLRGLILTRLLVEMEGRLVHTFVHAEDFATMRAEPSDTEDVINQTLAIAGTEFAVIFVGLMDGGYKISFRSRGRVDCDQLARTFGGGGHKAAAGATVRASFAEVQARVLEEVRQALQSG